MRSLMSGGVSPQEVALLQKAYQSDPSLVNLPEEDVLQAIRYVVNEERKAAERVRAEAQAAMMRSSRAAEQQNQTTSSKLLRTVRELNRSIAMAQIPITLGAQVFIDDDAKRKELLTIVDMLHRMTAGPVVADTMHSAYTGVRDAAPEQKAQARRDAMRMMGAEAAWQSAPIIRSIL